MKRIGFAVAAAAVTGLMAAMASAPVAETADEQRLRVAQEQVAYWCVNALDDTSSSAQRNLRSNSCAIAQRELLDAQSVQPTPTPTTTPTASPDPSPTPSPTPSSPSSTSTPPTSSPTQTPTSGQPGSSNTGVPDGITLRVSTGNRSISMPGTVIDGEEIRGCVTVNASDVTIKNSRIVGNGCFYAVENRSSNLVMTDVEITCGGTAGTGVTASRYTLVRADISGCENGLNIGGDVTLRDSWIHDLYLQGDAHTDGMQMNQGAANILIQHNTVTAPRWATSSIIMWNEGGPQNANVLITDNWLTGGGYVIYCPRQASTNVRITNNRLAGWGYGPADSCWVPNVAEYSGNVALG